MRTRVRAHSWSPLTGRGLALGLGLAAVGAVGPLAFRWAFGALQARDGCGPYPTRSVDYCAVMSKDLFLGAAFTAGWIMVGAYVLGFAVVFTTFTLLARWTGRREDRDTWWSLFGRALAVWTAGGAVFVTAGVTGLFGGGGPAAAALFWVLLVGTLLVLGGFAVLGAPRVSLFRIRLTLAALILLAGTAVPLLHHADRPLDGWTVLGLYAGWVLAVAVIATGYGPARPAPRVLRA